MNADAVITAVKAAVGDPTSGPIAAALPDIEAAIRGCWGQDDPTKATRVVKATETR